MAEEEEEFKLKPIISPSDKAFRDKVGVQMWERMKSKSFRDSGYKCCGCDFEPYDVDPNAVLGIHLIEENIEDPEKSEVITTCEICHMVQHADVAIERGYVELVNSFFKQGELVMICRNKSTSYHIEKGDIRYLKKTLPEFMEELVSGLSNEGKVKFVFTEAYLNSIGII